MTAPRLKRVPRTVRIASINVNGIRAATRKGMLEWIDQAGVDIMALQEVRANEEQLTAALPGWRIVHHEALQKGRSGVAVASRMDAGPSGQCSAQNRSTSRVAGSRLTSTSTGKR